MIDVVITEDVEYISNIYLTFINLNLKTIY